MGTLLVEIFIFLLTVSTFGAYRTFLGKTFLDVVLASVIIVFNYFSLLELLEKWNLYHFFLIVSSLTLVIFVFYRLLFRSNEAQEMESGFTLSPLSILLTLVVMSFFYFYLNTNRTFGDIVSIKDIPKIGKYEKTNTYNRKLAKVNFIVGTIELENYNADKDLAKLTLKWSNDAREGLESVPQNSTILASITPNKAKEIFDTTLSSDIDFYANIIYTNKEYRIVDSFLLYKKQKIMLTEDKNAPIITYTGKWNPLIYKGKRSYSSYGTDRVKDNYTGLVWQKSGSSEEMKWKKAKSYCSNLSMRLPTYNELYYLADRSKYNNAIDENYFKSESSYYWTDTKYVNDASQSWVVHFYNGFDRWYYRSNSYFVRCVQ